jgi:hypothetical protein
MQEPRLDPNKPEIRRKQMDQAFQAWKQGGREGILAYLEASRGTKDRKNSAGSTVIHRLPYIMRAGLVKCDAMTYQKQVIYSYSRSECCGALQQLVESRPGGFVSQNCEQCRERSNHVRLDEIPEVPCPRCGAMLTVGKTGRYDTYGCKCHVCKCTFKLADILFKWEGQFLRSPLPAPGD